MAHAKFCAEEIVEKLRQAEEFTSLGGSISEAVQSIGVSESTFYRWRGEYGGLLRTLAHAADEPSIDPRPSASACRDANAPSARDADRQLVVLHRRGVHRAFDITAIASELAKLRTGERLSRILFDWSQLRSWPFEPPSAASVRVWNLTAPAIARVAFVHDPKWSRHAAVISALLRAGNAEIRSFRPCERESAIAWLERP